MIIKVIITKFDDFKNRKQRLENARNQINNVSPRSNNQRTSRYVVKILTGVLGKVNLSIRF